MGDVVMIPSEGIISLIGVLHYLTEVPDYGWSATTLFFLLLWSLWYGMVPPYSSNRVKSDNIYIRFCACVYMIAAMVIMY